MRKFEKSVKLNNVCYDIRGPVMDEANRMIARGEEILKLNIGNPAPFGFRAPEKLLEIMQNNLSATEGYSDSKGIVSAREAIKKYDEKKNIPNVDIDDIYTGNGVSELITLSMQGLLDYGDEILVPAPDYPLYYHPQAEQKAQPDHRQLKVRQPQPIRAWSPRQDTDRPVSSEGKVQR